MEYQMIQKSLLDDLIDQAKNTPVIDIAGIAERRAPIVIELGRDAELALKADGVEIKCAGQHVILSSAVLDVLELFRKTQLREVAQ